MKLFRHALLILGLALLPAVTFAAPGPASKFVSDLGVEALRVFADASMTMDKRESDFRRLFLKAFDVNSISRFVVGNSWKTASDAERNEYRQLFEDYVVAAYTARLSAYSGEQFQVKDEIAAGDDIVVNTLIMRPSGPATRVEWRVRNSGEGLRIVDVVVEGVSMAITQRSEFTSVMQQGGKGLASLNAKLREKVASKR